MLVHPSSIDLSSRTLRFLTGQLTAKRRKIGTRWRRLPASRQALLALARLRCGDTYAQLAARFGTGIATVHRYIRKAVEGLSSTAPCCRSTASPPIPRTTPATPGNTNATAGTFRSTDPFGRLLWASPALPGSTHDPTAARHHGTIEDLADAGLKYWADKAYQGAGRPVRVSFRSHRLKRWKRRHNTTHTKIRCLGEQAMATLNGRRLLRKLRCSTNRVTDVVKAVLVLHHAST